jgi:hypothetical protein
MKKNTAGQVIGAQMVSASDGSAFTGSVTVYVTGDGGTQAVGSVGSGACAHEGNGFHSYAPAQAETNYGHVAFTFVGSGAVPATVQLYTTFPQTADAPTAIENADALLDRDMSAVSDMHARSPLNALRFIRNKWTLSGTLLSVKKEDDSTEAWTAAVSTSPGADPISGSDPA